MELAARPETGKGKRYQDRDYGKTIKHLQTTKKHGTMGVNQ
jgi:hypothetical protein